MSSSILSSLSVPYPVLTDHIMEHGKDSCSVPSFPFPKSLFRAISQNLTTFPVPSTKPMVRVLPSSVRISDNIIFYTFLRMPAPKSSYYTVPVITNVLTPGFVDHTPVTGSCVYVAAGTVICPATVENIPVVSS